jgi:hypothetical protein
MVAKLPDRQRVISGIEAPSLRVNAFAHMIDRVCAGRCYSYANYEPSTAQFRVRAVAENPIVVADYEDSWHMQVGSYRVQPRDLPLYQVILDRNGNMALQALQAGALCGKTYWDPL